MKPISDPGVPRSFGFDDGGDRWLDKLRDAESPAQPGSLGPYVELLEVGRGGQGVVFRARQPGTNRFVALKRCISGSFASAGSRHRFEREIEAISALRHPNIVTVYGVDSSDGPPLLAMEWIDGVPLHRWAEGEDGKRRAPRACLEMFRTICDAVQHAHRHGIIHRDLKPTNILVDAQGSPHVLDFGLAKRIDPGSEPSVTAETDFLGTLNYASPEQVRSPGEPIDVRTDVFSLGVLLYEMLTGRLPSPPTGSLAERVRALEEEEPRAPGVDRELDAIVLKALEKDRTRRYPSVEALAADVGRYLAGEPVLAHPPSALYQTRKFVGRHRFGVAFASTVALLTIGFALYAGREAGVLARERDVALKARGEAEANAAVLRHMLDLLSSEVFGAAHPGRKGRGVTVVETLDATAEKVDHLFPDDPETEATFRDMIGQLNHAIGRSDKAQPQFVRALEIRRRLHPGPYRATAKTLLALANAQHAVGSYAAAEASYRESIAAFLAVDGPSSTDRATVQSSLAGLLINSCRYPEAEQLGTEAVRTLEAKLRPDDPALAGARSVLGQLALARGRLAEAETIYRRSIEEMRGDEVGTSTLMTDFGLVLMSRGRLDEAEETLTKALEIRRRLLGEDHPDVGATLAFLADVLLEKNEPERALEFYGKGVELERRHPDASRADLGRHCASLAQLYLVKGDPESARALLESTLDEMRAQFGRKHTSLVRLEAGLAHAYSMLGQTAKAREILRSALESALELYGENHSDVALCRNALGLMADDAGDSVEARSQMEKAVAIERALFGPDHGRRIVPLINLASLASKRGDADALALLNESVDLARRALRPGHDDLAWALTELGRHLSVLAKRHAEAEPFLREALEIRRKDPTSWKFSRSEAILGQCLTRQEKWADAEPLLRAAYERLRAGRGPNDRMTLGAGVYLAQCLQGEKRGAEAQPLFLDSVNGFRALLGEKHPTTLGAELAYGRFLVEEGNCADAIPWLEEALEGLREVGSDGGAGTPAQAEALLAEAKKRISVSAVSK